MIDRLNLPLMGQQQERMQTAFTVSIEAREGVTTGISAADRAYTIQKAIAPDSRPEDIVTPGHVFPLRARDGGVLVRAGHTEAAVDVSRMAGLRPAGVICEIMKDDGTMARLDDLIPYAKKHDLKIGTIEDLIAFRRRTEKVVEQTSVMDFDSKWVANTKLHTYRNIIDGTEHLALVVGKILTDEPVIVRVHVENTIHDVLSPNENSLDNAMKQIVERGSGVLILIRDHNRSNLMSQDNRRPEYGIGSQILADLGVKNMITLTNNPGPVIGIDAYNIKIVGFKSIG